MLHDPCRYNTYCICMHSVVLSCLVIQFRVDPARVMQHLQPVLTFHGFTQIMEMKKDHYKINRDNFLTIMKVFISNFLNNDIFFTEQTNITNRNKDSFFTEQTILLNDRSENGIIQMENNDIFEIIRNQFVFIMIKKTNLKWVFHE